MGAGSIPICQPQCRVQSCAMIHPTPPAYVDFPDGGPVQQTLQVRGRLRRHGCCVPQYWPPERLRSARLVRTSATVLCDYASASWARHDVLAYAPTTAETGRRVAWSAKLSACPAPAATSQRAPQVPWLYHSWPNHRHASCSVFVGAALGIANSETDEIWGNIGECASWEKPSRHRWVI